MSKKKIKVTQVSRFAPPHIGGIEAVIEQINDSLPNENFEKEVFCCSNDEKSSVENGVKYNRYRYLFNFAANSISPQLFFGMIGLKTDILHFHMPVIQNVIIWFILYHLGLIKYKKLQVTYHSDVVGYDNIMKFFIPLYKYFLSKADVIHVLSPNIINSSNMIKIFKKKCVVIPQGLELHSKADYSSKIKEIKKKYSGKKILFSLGRHVKYKGFMYGIQAMENVDNAVYLLGGLGPLTESFKTYIKEHHLEEKVILLGRINDDDLDAYYQACDIYVFPSVMPSEAFGIVQIEAMKYSKPVINTWLNTGVNYVSIDRETGLTVEPKNVEQLTNAINELINNEELCLEYGRNSRQRFVELFNIDIIKEKYLKLANIK